MNVYEIVDKQLYVTSTLRSLPGEEKEQLLSGLGIYTVVQATTRPDRELAISWGTRYFALPFSDRAWPPDLTYLWAGASRLAEELRGQRPVLIFCTEGKNRAPFLACLTLICKGWRPREAMALLREKRPGCLSFQPFVDYLEGLE